MTTTRTTPTYEDMLEAFIDAAASAGLEPTDEEFPKGIEGTIRYFGADAFRVNGSDSLTMARLWSNDERVDLKVTTLNGVIMFEASFPLTRLGLRMFEQCAAVYP